MKHRFSRAISIFDGVLGVTTKAGFTPFSYDAFIEWAKKQGSSSPYKRLFTPLPSRGQRRPSKRSLCGRLRLKSHCRCHVIIDDANDGPSRPLLPTEQEVDLWKQSEHHRLLRKEKIGLHRCPKCPKSLGLCPILPVPRDIETLRRQVDDTLKPGIHWTRSAVDYWPFCRLTTAHVNQNYVQYDLTAIDERVDQDRDIDASFREVDLVLDVPLRQPDEPYLELTAEEFFRTFGFDLPDDYVPASFPDTD